MSQPTEQDFLLSTFREEIDGHIVTLTRVLVDLEETAEPTQATTQEQELMRVLHTIKGAARMLGFADITHVAHAMEEVIGVYRATPATSDRTTIDALFEGIDTIAELTRLVTRRPNATTSHFASPLTEPVQIVALLARFQAISGTDETTQQAVKPNLQNLVEGSAQFEGVGNLASANGLERVLEIRSEATKPDETIRVRLDKLDSLINAAGELVINKIQNDEHLQVMQKLTLLQRQRSRLASELREILIEQLPPAVRNELLGMTELFSFAEEKPSPSPFDYKRPLTAPVAHPTTQGEQLDSRTIGRIYKKLEEIILLDRKIEQLAAVTTRERKAYYLRYGTLADEMRRSMLDLRMLPLETLFSRFQRPIRDLANERGKTVRLVLSGGAIEIDKRVLEEISDPLIHLLRNAVDHGIELSHEREIADKPAEGTIRVAAFQKGNQVVIQVEDDGQGLDPVLLRQMAVLKNLLTPVQAAALNNETSLDLIFLPGFSTRLTSDEVSGRGYGMNIVQQNIKRLNGRVAITSTLGQGTLFTFEIPLTLATMGALLVRAAGQLFALPSMGVNGIQVIAKAEIKTLEGKKAVRLRGQITPVVNLAELLGLSPSPNTYPDVRFSAPDEATVLVVLVNAGGAGEGRPDNGSVSTERLVAFVVDELVDEREIVVKSLGSFLTNVPNIAGVTVLGVDGLALILDVFGLLQTVRLGQTFAATPLNLKDQTSYFAVRAAPRLLVVDDSLTTRELERSILEAAGYQVETARDGVEALQACRERPFDLVLTDVEMPNMDGFKLSSAIRSDTNLQHLPIVIVSSRESTQDRQRGLTAGAQAYIVKSHFEQNRLLDTISKLLDT